jgi:hypothetical protein
MLNRIVSFSDIAHDQQGLISRELISIAFIFVQNLPMKETILAACIDISSQPSFSRRIVSGSDEFDVFGSIGAPDGPKPRI